MRELLDWLKCCRKAHSNCVLQPSIGRALGLNKEETARQEPVTLLSLLPDCERNETNCLMLRMTSFSATMIDLLKLCTKVNL